MFGNPETTTGGNALKFYASVQSGYSQKVNHIKDGEDIIGNQTRVKNRKEQSCPSIQKSGIRHYVW